MAPSAVSNVAQILVAPVMSGLPQCATANTSASPINAGHAPAPSTKRWNTKPRNRVSSNNATNKNTQAADAIAPRLRPGSRVNCTPPAATMRPVMARIAMHPKAAPSADSTAQWRSRTNPTLPRDCRRRRVQHQVTRRAKMKGRGCNHAAPRSACWIAWETGR